jgi:hypothetical protein
MTVDPDSSWNVAARALGVSPLAFAKVAEWARAYVENETCIPELPADRLAHAERIGLELLAEIETEFFE